MKISKRASEEEKKPTQFHFSVNFQYFEHVEVLKVTKAEPVR